MREIKFRGWDVVTRTMRDWSDLKTRGMLVFENRYLMQFTGLKDKNGKEIYEGDVIYIPSLSIKPEARGHNELVEWKEWEEVPSYGWNPMLQNHSEYTSFQSEKMVEVIGNIYENPELLKIK
jgi:uncharacterized phage protein (TIGR01671 family)